MMMDNEFLLHLQYINTILTTKLKENLESDFMFSRQTCGIKQKKKKQLTVTH